MNKFINEIQKQENALTANGALAYKDTGSDLVNYFSNANNLYRGYEEVEEDLNKCWEENAELTLRMIVYVRSISRKSSEYDLEVKGLGIKNEGRLSLKWLYNNHREIFHKNLPLFIEFGNWQDIWHKDLIDWVKEEDKQVAYFIAESVFENQLCRKYLPRQKSKSNIRKKAKSIKTIEFKELRNKGLYLVIDAINELWPKAKTKMNMKTLMKLKSEGTAHEWQQHITNRNYLDINFDTLPGKVITWITKEKEGNSFLSRHKLEDNYINWLDKQDNIKTTSYIYELAKPAIEAYKYYYNQSKISKVNKYTIEKQIKTILNKAEVSNLNVMPVIDTSGSMQELVHGNISALDICVSLGVYFSMLQKGTFKDSIIGFSSTSNFQSLRGSFITRLKDVLKECYMGSTNFQSVIDLIIKTRISNPYIPIEDYPDVYLVISDMQFNDTGVKTRNHREAINKLKQAGLPEPIFIWYNVSPYGNGVYESHKDDTGIIQMTGYDPAALDRLLSNDFQIKFEKEKEKSIKEITPYEAMEATLNQDYLQLLKL